MPTTTTTATDTMTFRQFLEALACGLLFASPFIIEIIKELAR